MAPAISPAAWASSPAATAVSRAARSRPMSDCVEDRLRGAELEPVEVERIGDAGRDGDPELVEVERLPGDAPRCR